MAAANYQSQLLTMPASISYDPKRCLKHKERTENLIPNLEPKFLGSMVMN